MVDRLRTYIDQTVEMQARQTLEIPQGEVVRHIARGTVVNAAINPGACVLGITTVRDGTTDEFIAGHFFPGEIVRELRALASIGEGTVTVYQGSVEGEIDTLYSNGQRLTTPLVKTMFKDRDIHYLTNLT